MMTNPDAPPRSVDVAEAERLVAGGDVRVLDVRTPSEYRNLGHIEGAALLPVDLIACAVATLPRDDRPLLVYCEHGVRSAYAARFLARAGFPQVLNMSGGMSCWRGPREFTAGSPYSTLGPSPWLVGNVDLLPRGGEALDVACGGGRHALLLASAGWSVRAVDRDAEAIARLDADARRLEAPIVAETLDLEAGTVDLGQEAYDLILVVHYLHRPLFPTLARALRPGGLLLYETFTVDQAMRGKPTNPDFLLRHGELPELVAPLVVERSFEGESEDRMVAAVAARKAAAR
jgi:rhodanese-related sulfurtransferase